jgi:hypothetical protein
VKWKEEIDMQETSGVAVAPNSSGLLTWPNGVFNPLAKSPLLAHHRLTELDLFSDDVLVDLLDRYPRNRLQAWTMGTDPCRREDWKAVDTTGVSGKDLLTAVKRGRIWYNILRLDLFDEKYRAIVEQLYAEMGQVAPGFKPASAVGTLLLSSPGAQVYYHADGPPTTLFHVRGQKRLWIYPADDERFVSQELMEEIFGSAMDEEVPYSPEFDGHAVVYDLEPGDLAWWPLNAPHRIENLDTLNVSLSTRYQTDESQKRKLLYNANRFFRKRLGWRKLSVRESGLGCEAKCFTYRVCRRAGWDLKPTGYVYKTNLRVDPNAALGLATLTEPKTPAFSR